MQRKIINTLYVTIFTALFTVSTTVYSINDDPKLIKQFTDVQSVMENHKAGLNTLLLKIPDNIQDHNNPLFILSVLKSSVFQHLYWGRIDSNNKIYSLGPGSKNGFWAMIFELNHPKLSVRGPTFNTYKSNGLVQIVIRPDLISKRWAGLFFIHEFIYAYRDMHNQTMSPEEVEYNATKAEKTAYNYITENKFDTELDSLLKEFLISNHQDYLKVIYAGLDAQNDLYLKLESKMGERRPLSIAEGEMRFALYAFSFSLRLSELNQLPRNRRVSNLSEIHNYISKF